MNILGHFETITRHKLLVMKYCFECGLYEQGLAHDLSKYSPTEFIPGCIYYQGDHSPNEAEREARGYTSAWLHHKGRNKHHLEYWIDYSTNKSGMTGMKMPLLRYVCEMICDRVAASQIYLGEKIHRCLPVGILRAQQRSLHAPPGDSRPAGKAAENGARHWAGADLRVHEIITGLLGYLLRTKGAAAHSAKRCATAPFCLLKSVQSDGCLRFVGGTGAGTAFRFDLTGGGQAELGQGRADQLIHQHREEHDVAHHVAVGKLSGLGCHAQRHASLRLRSRVMPRYFWILWLQWVARPLT